MVFIHCLSSIRYGRTGKLVLVVQMLREGTVIDGEAVAGRQLKDLNRGRAYLCEMAERFGCETFSNVEDAMPSVAELAGHALAGRA